MPELYFFRNAVFGISFVFKYNHIFFNLITFQLNGLILAVSVLLSNSGNGLLCGLTKGFSNELTSFLSYPSIEINSKGLYPSKSSPKYDCKAYTDVPFLESIATFDEENEEMTVFCVNKSMNEGMTLDVNLLDFDGYKPFEFISI